MISSYRLETPIMKLLVGCMKLALYDKRSANMLTAVINIKPLTLLIISKLSFRIR